MGGHAYSLYFVVAAFVCLGIAVLVPMVVRRGETFERRCYWGGTFGAAISVFIAGIPDWVGSLSFACVAVFVMWLPAYFGRGELIKIRDKVYSFHVRRSAKTAPGESSARAHDVPDDYPDAYGTDVTAAKFWWLSVVATVFLLGGMAVGLTDPGKRMLLVLCSIALLIAAAGLGYLSDGSYGYPIARRQYMQLVLLSLMTAGGFAVVYLPAYFLGRRFPFRHRKSLEREARPRYWEE